MDNNTKNHKENRSMYLYTALIFVVAILLIILAFFGQSNISKLGNRADEIANSTEVASISPTNAPPSTEEFARISNMASALDKENKELKDKISVYDNLINANELVSKGNLFEAEEIINIISEDTLTESQKVLYKQIKDKISEGEER